MTTYTWDGSNRLARIKDGRNIVYLTNHYDANGRVSSQTLADPTASYTFAYALDTQTPPNITQTDIADPRQHTERITFNASHYAVTDIQALNTAQQRTTTERQSGSNLVTAVVDGLNRRAEHTYDTFGHVLTVKRLTGTPDAVTMTLTCEPTYFQLRVSSEVQVRPEGERRVHDEVRSRPELRCCGRRLFDRESVVVVDAKGRFRM